MNIKTKKKLAGLYACAALLAVAVPFFAYLLIYVNEGWFCSVMLLLWICGCSIGSFGYCVWARCVKECAE